MPLEIDDFKPNSHRHKEEQRQDEKKKVEKVVKGNVKVKKKNNEINKFKDVFISEDVHNVKNYIFMDVLVPALKKAVSDIVTNGIDMLLYGEARGRKNSNSSRISYRNYYDSKDDDRRHGTSRVRSGYNVNDIILETRGEAEDVLATLDEIIESYGMVSIADLYEAVGINGNYTDNKYGWTSLRSADVIRVRDGYMLKLPKATPL